MTTDNAPHSIILSAEGQTFVFNKAGQQIPALQVPWILLFAKFLDAQGVSPESISDVEFPGRRRGVFVKTEDGFNWLIK